MIFLRWVWNRLNRSNILIMSRSKQKGTMAETAVVSFLRTQGFPYAERLALQGSKDRGDVTGIPGVVIEVKNEATYMFSSWLKETAVETVNAGADHGFVAAKPRMVGVTRTGDWMAGMYVDGFRSLLDAAGVSQDHGLWVHRMSGANINRDMGRALGHLPSLMSAAQVLYGVVEICPNGVIDPDKYYAVTTLSQMSSLLVRAGYGRAADG